MPIKKAAKKWLRRSKKRQARNVKAKEELKEIITKTRGLIEKKKFEEAKKALVKTYSKLDRAAKYGVIKKNTASRKKSRLAQALNKAMGKKK